MNDEDKAKEQLSREVMALRRRVAEFEASETERKRAEEALQQRNRELELLSRTSHAFISTLALNQVLATVLEEVRYLLDVVACLAWLIDPATGELVCRQATGPQRGVEVVRGWRLDPGQGVTGRVALSGQSLIVPDVQADEYYFRDIEQLAGLEIHAMLSVPLRVKEVVIGVLQVLDTEVGRFNSTDLRLVESLAAAAAIAIENARLYEEANELRAFNENIVQSMEEGILVEDATGHITYANPSAAHLLGYSPEELAGQSWKVVVAPEHAAQLNAGFAQRLRDIGSRYETVLLTQEGQRVPVIISASPLFDVTPNQGGDRSFSGVLSVFTDITERKQAEEALRRRNRELALLNQIIAASASGLNLAAILETACRELALTFDVPQASAVLLNEEKTTATIVAEYRAERQPRALERTIPVEGNPLIQYLISHKTPVIVSDAQSESRLASVYDLLRQHGIVSLLILPLMVEGEVLGSLSLEAVEPRRFSAEEISLAWNVASQTAGALAQARLNEQRQRLEEQYRQAQKMEAVGQLTAGIAHDFNNMLTAINGFAELMRFELLPDDPLQDPVEKVLHAGRRAADLVRQLLTFSRKQVTEPQVLDLNAVVAEMDKMLRRTIGEDIELKTILAPDLWPVKVDPAQIEQVIVNLAVNARDAMPDGGRLTIELANVVLDDDYAASHLDVQPGEHVLLAVSDTGNGMSEEVKPHIFEPYFTTKEKGKGTGLGLATVYGIVMQSGGHIWFYSEEGQGTAFKIYLPRATEAAWPAALQRAKADMPSGDETILLVEDDESVRDLARRVLHGQGYTVLEAQNSQKAFQVSAHHAGPIHLLLTDVVMPGISGKALAEQLVQTHPDLKTLFMSGYTDNAIVHHGVLDPDVAFLQKPFRPMTLARKVRQVLDAP